MTESPRLSRSVICIIVTCHGLLIITVITPLPTKAQRDKNAEQKLANAAITDMQMRQRGVATLEQNTKELADAKAENDALRDDVAAGRRRFSGAVCQSVREATASGVDNAASRLADTAEQDYFTLRERLITMQKQLEGTQKYINEQCEDRVAHIDGQLMQYCEQYTRASSEYKC